LTLIETIVMIVLMFISAEVWFRYRMLSVKDRFFKEFNKVVSSVEDYDWQVRNDIITELLQDEVLVVGDDGVLIGYNNNVSQMLNEKSM
jgi:hypothetical protein